MDCTTDGRAKAVSQVSILPMKIRSALLLSLLFCFKAGLLFGIETEVPADVAEQIIRFQTDGIPTVSNVPEKVAEAYEGLALPQYVFVIDGVAVPRDKIIARMRGGKHLLQWFTIHDRTFLRSDNTIVVLALFDYAETVAGRTTVMKNTPFSETFVSVEGKWKLLTTIWTRLESPLPAAVPPRSSTSPVPAKGR